MWIVSVPFHQSSILCDVSSGSSRPLVPEVLCQQLFLTLHGISHPGVCAFRSLLSSRFVWPGLARDIGLWSRSCLRCQQSKIQTYMRSSVPSIPVPGRRFFHIHLDLVGPLPSSQGFSYILTIINLTSRWLEAVPLSSITTEALSLYLYLGLKVWSPSSPNLWQGSSVHLLGLGGGLLHPWSLLDPDFKFSPSEQWYDWEIS